MKIKNIVCFITMLMIFTGWPLTSLALGDGITAVSSSNVSCTIPENYDFSVPDDAVLQYPQTQLYLGEFSVGDILLKSGEKLNIFVTAGQLKKPGNIDTAIQYDIIFNAPSNFDSSAAGTSYGVAMKIDETSFEDAEQGTYKGSLLFQVVSNISRDVVWERDVKITALRRNGTEENQQHSNSGAQDDSNQQDDINENSQAEEFQEENIPEAGNSSGIDQERDSQTGIEKNENQTTNLVLKKDYLYFIWGLIACTVLAVIILIFIIRSKKKNNH